MSTDRVERMLAQWRQERPELDTRATALFVRFARLSNHLQQQLCDFDKKMGMMKGDFDVLATLRRSGEPYALTPTELYQSIMLSSGAMTNRLDKLEKRGLIRRESSDKDRRSLRVCLTPEGMALVDPAVEKNINKKQQMLEALSPDEQQQLNDLLKKWLSSFE